MRDLHASPDSSRSPAPCSAESAYLFRHALLRDAAYQLQLPGDRSQLHGLADHERRAEEARDGASPGARRAARTLYVHRAAEVADRAFRHDAAQALWLELAEIGEGAIRAEACRRAGVAAGARGRQAEAEELFGRARELSRRSRNRRIEGSALTNLAMVYGETGRVEQAERSYEHALAINREVGDRRFEAAHLGRYARLLLARSRPAEACDAWRRSAALLRQVGDTRELSQAVSELSAACAKAGVPAFDEEGA